MLSCYSAAISIIQISFVQLNLKNGPVSFTWSDIHHQVMAGITLLFTVWNSIEARTEAKKDLISFKGYLAQWNNVIEKTLKRWSQVDRAQQVLQRLAQSTVELLEDEVSGVHVQSRAQAHRSSSKEARQTGTSRLSFVSSTNTRLTSTNSQSRTRNDYQRTDSTSPLPNSSDTMQLNENNSLGIHARVSNVQQQFTSYSLNQRPMRDEEIPIYSETSNNVSPEGLNSLNNPNKHTFNPSDFLTDQPWDFSTIFGTNPLGSLDSSNMELPFSAAMDGFDPSIDFSDLFGEAAGLESGDNFAYAPMPGFQSGSANLNYYTFNTASALNFHQP